ncbi:ABC transporter substrate-binding protein [Candidatus Binatus sp.]|uniref:ABC transporter substrate-binding protein n=1 Tax=Candidatus Binatus sp. TaxID=2811406 RepID=UPI003C7FD603
MKAESPRNRILGTITCAIALSALAISAGCHVSRPDSDHAKNQILYTAVASDPRTFNPILITDATSGELTGDLFESLLRINPVTTLPEAGLAEKWDIAPDNKSITFHLRHDAKWFDGQPVTAHDVLFTLDVIYDPKVPNSIRPAITIDHQRIAAEAPDDYTVVMHLPKPFAPLLYSLGIQVMPAHILEPVWKAGNFNHTWGIDTLPEKIIGDGAYKMMRYAQSQVVNYDRNEDYWMKDEHGGQLPRLHGQNVTIVQDQNAAYLRYLSGQIDVYGPRTEEVSPLQDKVKNHELDITVDKIGIDTGSLFFSFNRNPRHFVKNGVTNPKLNWFTDLKFLQAMAHMIDKKSIIELVFHQLAESAVSDISPENKIFYNPDLKDYDYDPKLAADMLEAAGYHLVKPGVRTDPKGNRLEFDLTTNTGSPERDQMCTIFKQDVESLGIKVNYRPLEFTTLVDKLDSSFDWDCVLIGFTGGIEPNDGQNFYRSSGNLHIWDPNQPTPATPWEAEIDTLLDEGASEMDITKRPPYYWKIQQILHDQLPILETVRQQRYASWKNSLEYYQPKVWGLYKSEWMEFKAD